MRIEAEKTGDILIVTPMEKSIDASISADFKARMLEEIENGARRIVLDLSHVDFLDSSALGAMVSALKALGGVGSLAICGIREPVVNVFKLTRLDRVFRLYEGRSSACSVLSGNPGEEPEY
ncbi:MAG: STAS domain-containing protein [Proteobacteria bacterium]|nr:STAS domain-containing protein [Pseudomonadota bacterium]